MSAIKSGAVSHSRFAKMAEMDYKVSFMSQVKVKTFPLYRVSPQKMCNVLSKLLNMAQIIFEHSAVV